MNTDFKISACPASKSTCQYTRMSGISCLGALWDQNSAVLTVDWS